MASKVAARDIRVGPKGGLFVYRKGAVGNKRYLSGEAKEYITDARQLATVEALQAERRQPPRASLTKTSMMNTKNPAAATFCACGAGDKGARYGCKRFPTLDSDMCITDFPSADTTLRRYVHPLGEDKSEEETHLSDTQVDERTLSRASGASHSDQAPSSADMSRTRVNVADVLDEHYRALRADGGGGDRLGGYTLSGASALESKSKPPVGVPSPRAVYSKFYCVLHFVYFDAADVCRPCARGSLVRETRRLSTAPTSSASAFGLL
jgi:hypothetical protein